MKMKLISFKQQTQDFVLRLFVESDTRSTLSSSPYITCARCGTYARLHS